VTMVFRVYDDPSAGTLLWEKVYDTIGYPPEVTVTGGLFTVALGDPAPSRVLVATTGVVPCKVDASFGPIHRGDLLVSSPTPGHAMKAQPVPVSGIPIYQSGTLIGKALEPLESGTGVIQVLVTSR